MDRASMLRMVRDTSGRNARTFVPFNKPNQ